MLIALLMVGVLLPVVALQPGQPWVTWALAASTPSATPTRQALVTITRRTADLHATRTATQTITPFRPTPPTATRLPTSTPPPTAKPSPTLPVKARIEGIYGYGQLLPLSCESRSAADWARHFGVDIREMQFFERLPKTGDPETGFVGSPYGSWGQIPPAPYGVHAQPVAELLREYGLKASARRNLPLEEALAEIAAGRPVMVWVTGHVEPGKGVEYPINGQVRTVARYEHTVLLIGYDGAAGQLTFLDGKTIYQRSTTRFQAAWSPLENMAIVWDESIDLP